MSPCEYPKPTRLVTDIPGIKEDAVFHKGWPTFGPGWDHGLGRQVHFLYLGPLPGHCGHEHPDMRRDTSGEPFKSGAAGVFHEDMLRWIIQHALVDWRDFALTGALASVKAPMEPQASPLAGRGVEPRGKGAAATLDPPSGYQPSPGAPPEVQTITAAVAERRASRPAAATPAGRGALLDQVVEGPPGGRRLARLWQAVVGGPGVPGAPVR